MIKWKALRAAASYGARRLCGGYVGLAGAAAQRELLVSGASVAAITPFYWPSHLGRIQGAATYGRERVIAEDLNRRIFELRPVYAYTLRDACLLDGSIYAGRHRHQLRPHTARRGIGLAPREPAAAFAHAVLASTCAGSTWFGHWLEDEVPLQLLAGNFGMLVGHDRPAYRDEAAYREAFALPPLQRVATAHFECLVVIDEFAQNPHKTRRYHMLRARLKHRGPGRPRIFLSRGGTGSRRVLVNEAQICDRLQARGFDIVDVAVHDAGEIIEACRGAELVVGVEGSHLAPLLYLMRDFGTLVILNPPAQVHTTVADIGVFCGLSSGMFICEPASGGDGDFSADPEELCRFIDATERHSRGRRDRLEDFLGELAVLAEAGGPPAVEPLP